MDKPTLWTSEQAASVTGGICTGNWQASGVSIDSRTVEQGDLFIAIAGPSHDGHEFVASALRAGASAAVIHRDQADQTDLLALEDRLLKVENSISALEMLGQAARERMQGRVVGVTGSVGKTGTKEMLKLVLADQGLTTATTGNLNNHFGLPLSLARMAKETEFGVFEMGMSSPGEIEPLSKMARPHVVMITAIEHAHSEYFSSIEEIADAKAEIFAGLEPDGVAILNADSPMIDRLVKRAVEAGVGDVRTFGEKASSDCRLLHADVHADRSLVVADLRGLEIRFEIPVPGRHWVQNALGVLCAVDALGGDPERASQKLNDMPGLKGRGRVHTLAVSGGTLTLIDESYNASPASMKAAIDVLGRARTSAQGRRIAVLGDMLELGDQSVYLHEDLAADLAKNAIDLVFTTGTHMSALSSILPSTMRGGHTQTAEALCPLVRSVVRAGDVVTVKGSFGSRTGLIVDDLLKLEWNEGADRATSRVVNGN